MSLNESLFLRTINTSPTAYQALKTGLVSYIDLRTRIGLEAALNVKKNSSDFVIQINNIQRNNLNQLIIELSKKFCYKGNKSDFRPLIFIVNCTDEQYLEFKKSLYISLVSGSEDIKINDGYEDYHFNKIIFKQNPLVTKNKGSSKYEDVSYSFKLLHQQKYNENVSEITFSNPSLFILDKDRKSVV